MFTKKRAKPGSKKLGCLGIIGLLFLCGLPAVFTQERSDNAPSALVEVQATEPSTLPINALVDLPTNTPVALPTSMPTELPTSAPIELPTVTPTALPAGPTVNSGANLRAGPGVDYPVMNTAAAGATVTIVGRNDVGDWYQTDSGLWISAGLVDNPPTNLAIVAAPLPPVPAAIIVAAPAQPAAAPVADAPATGNSNPDAFVCNGGCTQPPPGSTCVIKGNVNSNKELIYHTTSSRSYKNTDIKPEEGDRWFCTEAEAQAAGFRAPEN
jgi:hypothetical protein